MPINDSTEDQGHTPSGRRDSAVANFRAYQRNNRKCLIFDALLAVLVSGFAIKDALEVPTPWIKLGGNAALLLCVILMLARDVLTGHREGRLLLRRAVIAILTADGPAYGLELRRSLGIGPRIYVYLREMEDEGLLVSEERGGFPCRGGRPRRYYRLKAKV